MNLQKSSKRKTKWVCIKNDYHLLQPNFIYLETSIGDEEPGIKSSPEQESPEEEEKIETAPKVQKSSDILEALADVEKDEKGAISVRNYALSSNKPDFQSPKPPVIPPSNQPEIPCPVEEEKKEDDEVDQLQSYLKAKRLEEVKEDDEDREDEENIRKARKTIVRKSKEVNQSDKVGIKADDFLDGDKPAYSNSVWVEIINEEGDKVYLNRVTGEVALKMPDQTSMLLGAASTVGLAGSEEKSEDWRWLPDKEEAWIPSQFMRKKPNGKYEYQDIEGVMFSISEKMHNKGIKFDKKSLQNYVHDLLMLDEINEANILYNIKNRFNKHRIYTRLGKILISVNPYKLYPLYSTEVIERYKNVLNVNQLPPHVYEVAKGAIEELVKSKHPQSILIAGESGSGKTEA